MQRFGQYTNLVEIGRGGMAVVYRATAPDGRLVALKLLPPHLAADTTIRARFAQESNLGLEHPNIVRVNRSGVIDGTPYIEMEYVPGESLDRLIMRAGPLSPEAAARILQDASRALDYAHGRGVIHRDVKPSNVIIRTDGSAMLADFGIAKAMGITAYTATIARVGSVFFMSPEQAAGAFELTPASDIYSLGATAYYALTGHPPFEAGSDVAIARQHIEQPPRHPSDLRPAIPRAVGDIVIWALQKAPARRPPSAGAFARSFAIALRTPSPAPPRPEPHRPSVAQQTAAPAGRPATIDETLARLGRTPRWLWVSFAGAVTLACLAMLAVVVLALPQNRPGTQPTPARASPQPALFIVTPQPTATPFSALAPATATPRSPAPTLAMPPATATPQVVRVSPVPTRIPPPTRAPITPLAPITSDATPPPPPPLLSPLPTAGVIVVTTLP